VPEMDEDEDDTDTAGASDEALTYTIRHDGNWTWLWFSAKPNELIRTQIKSLGFRWGRGKGEWYCKRNIDDARIQIVIGAAAKHGSADSTTSKAPRVDIPVGGKKSPYYRSADYHDKRAAKVVIADALREAGWTIHGFHADRSDAMTDYFAPASWEGVASKDDWVVVVDAEYAAKHYSGQKEGWPTFSATPGASNWHVEYKGQILEKGIGLARCYRGYYEGGDTLSHRGTDEPKLRPEQKAAKGFVEQIDALRTYYESLSGNEKSSAE
jgi:hypothetical protein